MKNLIIIGARGYGRETFNLAKVCKEFNSEWIVKGFLDDHSDSLKGYKGYPPILGPVETYNIRKDDVFVCALGDVNYKAHYVNIIKEKGGVFIPLIYPESLISHNVSFGEGIIISPYVSISCDIKIGDFVTIQSFSDLGHDVQIGNFCHINAYSFLGGYVKLGSYCTINTGAKIIPKLTIGDNTVVGAGSVVIKSVHGNCTIFGNPAKLVF